MIKSLLVTLFGFLIFCPGYAQNEKFKVFGEVIDAPDSLLVILFNRDLGINVDSSRIIDQQFTFKGSTNDIPSLSYINFYDKNGVEITPYIYTYFYLQPGEITVKGNFSDFINSSITGSPETNLLSAYNEIKKQLKAKYDLQDQNENLLYQNELHNKRVNFIFNNANSQVAIHNILYLKKDISKDSLLLFYNKLDTKNANSIKGKELFEYASSSDIKVGDKFRDIWGFDLNGNKVHLSDFEGKVILLDFWGTGCKPCHEQNRKEFQQIISRYNTKDFVLISYSIDSDKSKWEMSSKKDNISWVNISDLKGFRSENVKKYAVQAIPNSFLIDQNGFIVNSFIGFKEDDNEIEEALDKLLNE